MNFDDLLNMNAEQLDDLFKESPPGPIPDGEAEGRAIIAPGTDLAGPLSKFIHLFTWQGKVFDAKRGFLRNSILPFGLKAIIAMVGVDKSWLDGKDCIVLDYSDTSISAHWIRDEIRLVSPDLYLGIVYWGKTRLIHFALQFPG